MTNEINDSEEQKPNKIPLDDILNMIEGQIESILNLPEHAKFSFVTNNDLCYSLMLVLSALRSIAESSE